MNERGFQVIGVSSKGQFLEDVKNNEGIRTEAIEMTRTISPIKDLKALYSFYRLCKKEKPLIVHSHTPKAGVIGMLGAKLAGVPLRLHTVAGLPLMEVTGGRRKVLDWVEKLTYRCATMVYPNSQGLYDFILESKYTKKEKIKVIGRGSSNGIDTAVYSPLAVSNSEKSLLRERLGIKPTDFIFVFVGRLVGDKGINELVRAFTKIYSDSRVAKLLLVGPVNSDLDPLHDEVQKEIKTNPKIITVGFQNDVRPYYAISDALAFPSYREGFPNAVMQAGAMGLPSIVTNINGCNEIITHGVNGIIIPPKNEEKLLQAMDSLIEDTALYNTVRDNARSSITSRYEQKYVWNELLKEYKMLVNQL